jgi:hypothetical protein
VHILLLCLSRKEITSVHASFRDIIIHPTRCSFGLLIIERRSRQRTPESVENKHFDLGLSGCVLGPIMHGPENIPERREQSPACLLQPLPVGLADVFFKKDVEEGQLVISEPLFRCATFFGVEAVRKFNQLREGLFNRYAVFFAVVAKWPCDTSFCRF